MCTCCIYTHNMFTRRTQNDTVYRVVPESQLYHMKEIEDVIKVGCLLHASKHTCLHARVCTCLNSCTCTCTCTCMHIAILSRIPAQSCITPPYIYSGKGVMHEIVLVSLIVLLRELLVSTMVHPYITIH